MLTDYHHPLDALERRRKESSSSFNLITASYSQWLKKTSNIVSFEFTIPPPEKKKLYMIFKCCKCKVFLSVRERFERLWGWVFATVRCCCCSSCVRPWLSSSSQCSFCSLIKHNLGLGLLMVSVWGGSYSTEYKMGVHPSIVTHWNTVNMAKPILSKEVMP